MNSTVTNGNYNKNECCVIKLCFSWKIIIRSVFEDSGNFVSSRYRVVLIVWVTQVFCEVQRNSVRPHLPPPPSSRKGEYCAWHWVLSGIISLFCLNTLKAVSFKPGVTDDNTKRIQKTNSYCRLYVIFLPGASLKTQTVTNESVKYVLLFPV